MSNTAPQQAPENHRPTREGNHTQEERKPDFRSEKKKAQPKHKVHDFRFHLQIQEHDLSIKVEQAKKYLEKRDQVRIAVQLKGRERSRPESGLELLNKIVERLADFGAPAAPPRKENLIVTLNPKKAR